MISHVMLCEKPSGWNHVTIPRPFLPSVVLSGRSVCVVMKLSFRRIRLSHSICSRLLCFVSAAGVNRRPALSAAALLCRTPAGFHFPFKGF